MHASEYDTDSRRFGLTNGASELAERLESQIERRAGGRIRDLHVICSHDEVTLHGHSRTYHAKQLAQQAALELLAEGPMLTNQIVVR